jgi:hypothetical protein
MPREYVYGPASWPKEQDLEVENERFAVSASVGWNKETGHVQLATIRNGSEGSFDPKDGLYMDMDRRSINELIRLLRRARDGAFGKDE